MPKTSRVGSLPFGDGLQCAVSKIDVRNELGDCRGGFWFGHLRESEGTGCSDVVHAVWFGNAFERLCDRRNVFGIGGVEGDLTKRFVPRIWL